jgi:hypothetical protein
MRRVAEIPIFLDEIVARGEKSSGRYKQVIQKRLQLLQRLPLSDEIFYELVCFTT